MHALGRCLAAWQQEQIVVAGPDIRDVQGRPNLAPSLKDHGQSFWLDNLSRGIHDLGDILTALEQTRDAEQCAALAEIAEQNMLGAAMGLAASGKRPCVATFAAFQRGGQPPARSPRASNAGSTFRSTAELP